GLIVGTPVLSATGAPDIPAGAVIASIIDDTHYMLSLAPTADSSSPAGQSGLNLIYNSLPSMTLTGDNVIGQLRLNGGIVQLTGNNIINGEIIILSGDAYLGGNNTLAGTGGLRIGGGTVRLDSA